MAEEINGIYPGYYSDDPGDTFNGEPIPWFEKKIMFIMVQAEYWRSKFDRPMIRHLGDGFIEMCDRYYEPIVPEEISTVDGVKTLFSPGKERWTWNLIN